MSEEDIINRRGETNKQTNQNIINRIINRNRIIDRAGWKRLDET